MSKYEFDYSNMGSVTTYEGYKSENDLERNFPTLFTMMMPMHPADKERFVASELEWNDGDEDDVPAEHYDDITHWMILGHVDGYDNDHNPLITIALMAVAYDGSGVSDTPQCSYTEGNISTVLSAVLNGTVLAD